ncbi:MAG: PilZ domain-containing protein [Spirochaetales bacterium]|nr:PilZ domain-containing protein [Spirochaetales bacterium]
MEQNLLVISRSAEIRSSFAEAYALLGYEVSVYEEVQEPIRELNALDPDHVVVDTDGLERLWKILAAGLQLAQKRITVILIASAMTLEEASEALALGVSGIIIKPFLPEFHLKRAYEIIHRKLRVEGGRLLPRYYTGSLFDGGLTVHSRDADKLYSFELVNVSERGAAVRSRHPDTAPELQEGVPLEKAILRLDDQEFRFHGRVVFRKGGLLGLVFDRFETGEANFRRFLQRLALKAFGVSGLSGRW